MILHDELIKIILIDFSGYEKSINISAMRLKKTIYGYYLYNNNRLYLCNNEYLVFHEINK